MVKVVDADRELHKNAVEFLRMSQFHPRNITNLYRFIYLFPPKDGTRPLHPPRYQTARNSKFSSLSLRQ